MRGGDGVRVEDFAIRGRAAMKIGAVPGGDPVGPIMRVVLRDINVARYHVRRTDPVDAPALWHWRSGFDQAGTRLDAVTRIDMRFIYAISQENAEQHEARRQREPSERRTRPTPHQHPSHQR